MSCQVKVSQGILQGKECVSYNGTIYKSFEGIPYAKPPVGRLRFRCPVEPENWSGIRDATKPGNKCLQLKIINSNIPIVGSEDCLYLNVYTPSLPQEKIEKLPVMFFIHGGKLLYGSGDYYRPDYLMHRDVILVTINYRLNIFGFLCLNIPEAPGNAGLKDTIMALKWVKKNISNFNGDANNITVFGESAGGAIVHSFLTSKMADGLFHKIIAQSGISTADLYIIDDNPIDPAKNLATNLGKDLSDPKELYEFLYQVPAEELMHGIIGVILNRPKHIVTAPFIPVIEKEFDGIERFYDEHPSTKINEQRINKVPLLTGLNTHESAFFVERNKKKELIFHDLRYLLPRYSKIDPNSERAKVLSKKLHEYYFKGKPINEESKKEYVRMLSDFYFNFEMVAAMETYSKNYDNMYFYKFAYDGSINASFMKNVGLKGAAHGDVIQYEFYTKNKYGRCNETDKKIIDFINETLCNFAKTGKPTWSNQKFEWLAYTPENRNCLIIDKELRLSKDEDYKNYVFWKNLVGIRAKL